MAFYISSIIFNYIVGLLIFRVYRKKWVLLDPLFLSLVQMTLDILLQGIIPNHPFRAVVCICGNVFLYTKVYIPIQYAYLFSNKNEGEI